MASDLPPYSGDTTCPKCGSTIREAIWHPGPTDECQESGLTGEHMCRPCRHCGYGWAEATADATADA